MILPSLDLSKIIFSFRRPIYDETFSVCVGEGYQATQLTNISASP